MKVAYPMRVDALDKPGGDLLLMRGYLQYCTEAAVKRGIPFEGVITTDLNPDFSDVDVVHLTNIDRPVDLYQQFKAAKRSGKRTVLTPLHHSYKEIALYERRGRGGVIGIFSGIIGYSALDTLRSLVKSRKYPELRTATLELVMEGVREGQSQILRGVDVNLVAADKELADIQNELCDLSPEKTLCVRNGFEMPQISSLVPPSKRDIDICVMGRIESRKNQIAILEALESLGLGATFIGHENPNHKKYCRRFKEMIAESQSRYLGGVPFAQVNGYLARSRIHVAASWFEVSSRLDIEAYVLGCRVVASACGGTSELLRDDAYYVDPASTESIAQRITEALKSSREGFVNSIDLTSGAIETWEQIAERLLDIYRGKF